MRTRRPGGGGEGGGEGGVSSMHAIAGVNVSALVCKGDNECLYVHVQVDVCMLMYFL